MNPFNFTNQTTEQLEKLTTRHLMAIKKRCRVFYFTCDCGFCYGEEYATPEERALNLEVRRLHWRVKQILITRPAPLTPWESRLKTTRKKPNEKKRMMYRR